MVPRPVQWKKVRVYKDERLQTRPPWLGFSAAMTLPLYPRAPIQRLKEGLRAAFVWLCRLVLDLSSGEEGQRGALSVVVTWSNRAGHLDNSSDLYPSCPHLSPGHISPLSGAFGPCLPPH